MFDPLYLLIMLVTLVLSIWASGKVKFNFAKFSRIPNSRRLTGAQVAKMILDYQDIRDVTVETTRPNVLGKLGIGGDGILDDHYDPRVKKVRLSPQVYQGTSQAALAIAAHEVGHAIQHHTAYAPFKLRSVIAPAAALGSNFSYLLIFMGFIVHSMGMIKVGILLFSIAVLFQFITLPVEWDASRRAKVLVQHYNIAQSGEEAAGVSKLLNAAALTYVAAAAAALLNLLYLLFRTGLLGNRR